MAILATEAAAGLSPSIAAAVLLLLLVSRSIDSHQ